MKAIKQFFSSPAINTSRLRISGYARREAMPPCIIHRPQGTGDYLFMHFHSPVLGGWAEDEAEGLEARTLMIWEPGHCQFYGHHQKKYLHTWLHCDGTAVKRMLGSGIPRRKPIFPVSPRSFEKLITDLHEELAANSPPDPIIAENLLENWLRDVGRQAGDIIRQPPERLMRVRNFMDTHFNEALSLGQLAKMANWSVVHFSEEFRKHYGKAPIDHVIQQRMHRAVYLLRDINQSVTEVGRAVGYEDIYHFSKLFKRHIGVAPRKAREQLLEKLH